MRISTGFRDLDSLTDGMKRGEMIVLAGAPTGAGKSTLALNIAANLACAGKSVMVFSFELPEGDLAMRFASSMKCSPSEFGGLNFWVYDGEVITAEEIRENCLRVKRENGLDFVVVDKLHDVADCYKEERWKDAIDYASRMLKALAKELDVPILCASKLNRAAYDRDATKPKIEHLCDSVNIVHDADQVWLLSRDTDLNSAEAELEIAKNNGGDIGVVKLKFSGERYLFSDWVYGF
jgi:replicative DNA helicase